MGLRCLLGHDFTEPTTEREREQRGDEVITSIRQVKECRRCGETQVVSETTEVASVDRRFEATSTTVESGTSGAPRGTDTGVPETDTEPTGTADPGTVTGEAETGDDGDGGFDHPRGDPAEVDPSVGDDAEIIEEGPSDVSNERPPEGETESAPASAPERPEEPSARMSEWESASDQTGERGHGEWPDSTKTHPADADANTEASDRSEQYREWPDPDARADAESESSADAPATEAPTTEDAAATEARSDIVSDTDHPDSPETTAPASPADEDAEFIDADESDDGDAWPEQTGEDEGFDAEVSDGRPDEDVTVDGNLTPRVNPNADVDEDVEFIEASSDSPAFDDRDSSFDGVSGSRNGQSSNSSASAHGPARNGHRSDERRAERSTSTREVELTTTVGDQAMEYLCPECGKRERVGASSMRAGDICPECKRGYIEEHELD